MMTIRYRDGHAVEAITLTQTDRTIRVALPATDDVLELTRLRNAWVTEDCEPVSLEYGACHGASPLTEDDFICPRELATRLCDLLASGDPEGSSSIAFDGGPLHTPR